MKLLLRANSHRRIDGVLEIASSPDTPRRERWQWHLRTAPADTPSAANAVSAPLPLSDGSVAQLRLTIDPGAIGADMASVDLTGPIRVQRSRDELVMLVVGRGAVLLDKTHLLGGLDTLVVAGDDPVELTAAQASAEPASLIMIRLHSVDDGSVTWVP
jgi:hypothetical protein